VDLIGRRFVPFENLIKKRNSKYEMHASGYDKIMDVPFLSGCFMFFRTSALEYVKGFSERYWMYCEDIDICRRVGKRYRTRYFPYVTAKHLHKKESFTNKKMLRAHINSAVKYFNYWGWIFDRNRKVINQHAESQFI
jgi:GT2 family glycosyltransferase